MGPKIVPKTAKIQGRWLDHLLVARLIDFGTNFGTFLVVFWKQKRIKNEFQKIHRKSWKMSSKGSRN